MNQGKLVPQNNSSQSSVNYEKLAEALRRDMREAAESLLHAFYHLRYATTYPETDRRKYFAAAILTDIEDALAKLDCIDHIPVISDEEDADHNFNELMAHIDEDFEAEVDEDILENLVDEAIESGDYAVIEFPPEDCCPDCGGFYGCDCEGGDA